MTIKLEHVNITVPDLDAAIRFVQTVAPDWITRHRGINGDGRHWAHIGDGDSYIRHIRTLKPQALPIGDTGITG